MSLRVFRAEVTMYIVMKKIGFMKKRVFVIGLILISLITGCNKEEEQEFIKGVDVSSILAQEESGVIYRNKSKEPQDIFQTLSEVGINYVRIRIWNDPYDEDGQGYGGGNCDLEKAVQIGRRATKYGMKVFVDFHYSDFWADPGKQMAPKAWNDMELDEKEKALKEYTYDCLNEFYQQGIKVGMVQIGNEINNGLCGETNWESIATLLHAGSQAVRDMDSDTRIVVHFTDIHKDNDGWFAEQLKKYKVNYDVFATSYYSYWHGTVEHMSEQLSKIADTYNKEVLVAETAYCYTLEDTDYFGNTISEQNQELLQYEVSVDGQTKAILDVVNAIQQIGDAGLGVFYWEPAWITVGQQSYTENEQLWNKYGSGWASKYCGDYDTEDGGLYYGGSSWDNQALFDVTGCPLSSLYEFGNKIGIN